MQTLSHEDTQLVTLGVGGELFGIEVSAVREILDFQDITPLPYAPPYILGMINVRGSTVPVVDLRTKLNLPRVEATGFTRILVLEIQREEEAKLPGKKFKPAVEPPYRWRDWAAKPAGIKRLQAETAAELDALLPAILDKAFKGEL